MSMCALFQMSIDFVRYTIWLWLAVRHGFSMALIEIDGILNLKMGGSFHGKLLVITIYRSFSQLETSIYKGFSMAM